MTNDDGGDASSLDDPAAPQPMPGMDADATLLASHVFRCARCPDEAGTVKIWLDGSAVKLERSTFTGRMTCTIPNESASDVIAWVVRGDNRKLFEFDFEISPFTCTECDQMLCGKHWTWWNVFDDDGWQDSIRGSCPDRHERMLED